MNKYYRDEAEGGDGEGLKDGKQVEGRKDSPGTGKTPIIAKL